MTGTTGRTYRTREFATLAGVTVRALHHYDRLGLLRPRRTPHGYRVYGDGDLAILEQIVALKFVGLPLKSIKRLLRKGGPELADALRAQRTMLEQKRQLIDRTITAICEAETALRSTARPDPAIFTRIIEGIEMQNTNDWKKQFEQLVRDKLERLQSMSPDEKADIHGQFAALFKEVEGSLDENPASSHVQGLVDRYIDLLRKLAPKAGLDPQLQKVVAAYLSSNDLAKTPEPQPPFGGTRVWEFMGRALSLR